MDAVQVWGRVMVVQAISFHCCATVWNVYCMDGPIHPILPLLHSSAMGAPCHFFMEVDAMCDTDGSDVWCVLVLCACMCVGIWYCFDMYVCG